MFKLERNIQGEITKTQENPNIGLEPMISLLIHLIGRSQQAEHATQEAILAVQCEAPTSGRRVQPRRVQRTRG